MRLTSLTDYATRLLMFLAQRPDRLCAIAGVASRYGVSEVRMMKAARQPGLAGWLETVRGSGGGIRLAQGPQDIFIGSVVCSMEPDFSPVECFSTGNACGLTGACKPAGVVNGARRSFMAGPDGILPAPAGLAAAGLAATQVIRLLRQTREQPA